MRVAIGSDYAGFDLKETLKEFLTEEHHDVVDVGTNGRDAVDYSDSALAVGTAVRANRADRGIIVCSSGVGASVAANRMGGIRASLCHDTYSAHQGVEHDDMNVLVLGGLVVGTGLAREVSHAFLSARFTGDGRHPPPAHAVPIALDDRLREIEADLITWALDASHGNKSRAAELLQIKRSTLGDRIARCGLDRVAARDVDASAKDAADVEPEDAAQQ